MSLANEIINAVWEATKKCSRFFFMGYGIHDKLQPPLNYSCSAEKTLNAFFSSKMIYNLKDQLKVPGINEPCFIFFPNIYYIQ